MKSRTSRSCSSQPRSSLSSTRSAHFLFASTSTRVMLCDLTGSARRRIEFRSNFSLMVSIYYITMSEPHLRPKRLILTPFRIIFLSVWARQKKLMEYQAQHGIVTEAYSALMYARRLSRSHFHLRLSSLFMHAQTPNKSCGSAAWVLCYVGSRS